MLFVVSLYFVQKKTAEENPFSTLWYNRPLKRRHCILERIDNSADRLRTPGTILNVHNVPQCPHCSAGPVKFNVLPRKSFHRSDDLPLPTIPQPVSLPKV